MNRYVRTVVTGALVGAALLAAAPQAAHAEVWNCRTEILSAENYAYAVCDAGFGTYRVAVTCNSPHPPYTRTIVGPWVTKSSGSYGPLSTAYGHAQGCQVVGTPKVQVR